MKNKMMYMILLGAFLAFSISGCGKESNDDKPIATTSLSDSNSGILDNTKEMMEESADQSYHKNNSNKDINYDSFKCSDEIKNAKWEDGKYQYFDMILPVGITYAELQEIAKTSSIEFDNYVPTPKKDEETKRTIVYYSFNMDGQTCGFVAYICPPDLQENSQINYNEWIVIGYGISYNLEWGGKDYAWYPGGYSANNFDWMPDDKEGFCLLLNDWGITKIGACQARNYKVESDFILVYLTFDNCKIGDYFVGEAFYAYYDDKGKRFWQGSPLFSTELQDSYIKNFEDIIQPIGEDLKEENTDETKLVSDDGIFYLENNINYTGHIKDVSRNADGDYEVLWSELVENRIKFIPTSVVQTFYLGMIYQIYEDGPNYKCVEGDDSDYWYFIEEGYENFDEAYWDSSIVYRVIKEPADEKAALEYIYADAIDTFELVYDPTVYEDITTILDKDAAIKYLIDYSTEKEVPFEEFYNSNYTSVYAETNKESWRGLMTMRIGHIKNGKIVKITELMVVG